jgi:hypothetical protein
MSRIQPLSWMPLAMAGAKRRAGEVRALPHHCHQVRRSNRERNRWASRAEQQRSAGLADRSPDCPTQVRERALTLCPLTFRSMASPSMGGSVRSTIRRISASPGLMQNSSVGTQMEFHLTLVGQRCRDASNRQLSDCQVVGRHFRSLVQCRPSASTHQLPRQALRIPDYPGNCLVDLAGGRPAVAAHRSDNCLQGVAHAVRSVFLLGVDSHRRGIP